MDKSLEKMGEAYIEDSYRGAEDYGTTQQLVNASQKTSTDSHSGTSAASGFMGWTKIWDKSLYNYDLPTDWEQHNDLRGYASSLSDAIEQNYITLYVDINSGGCDIWFRLYDYTDTEILIRDKRHGVTEVIHIPFPYHKILQGHDIGLQVKRVGNATNVDIECKIWEAQKHTHTMTNPANHNVTNPDHTH